MKIQNTSISLSTNELESISDLLESAHCELRKGYSKYREGESLMEQTNYDSEDDVEYMLDLYSNMQKKVHLTQSSLQRNEVKFMDQDNALSSGEEVYIYHVRGAHIDKLVYLHFTRHGAYYFYPKIENLMKLFTEGTESKVNYGSEVEMVHFLTYWNGQDR